MILNLQIPSTCVEAIPGDRYLGGLAKATDVPQDSLDNFDLPLYCVSNPAEGIIDFSEPVAILEGGFVFLEGGIIK